MTLLYMIEGDGISKEMNGFGLAELFQKKFTFS